MSSKDNWSEYWQNEGASGEVFVNQSGEKHQALSMFWRSKFENQSGETKLIDLASGAGSVFSELHLPETCDLWAADISPEALKQLKKRMPAVNTQVCSADKLPFEDRSYDVVVSQFGIEYAGIDAFAEAARILKSGGQLVVLCHIEDGYIDSRNKAELAGAELIKKTLFIEKAIKVTQALYGKDKATIEAAIGEFSQVEPLFADYCQKVGTGVHVHLYAGFKQLMSKLNAYGESDVTNWLKAMEGEVDKAILRLSEMRKAANSEREMNKIVSMLREKAGLTQVEVSPFTLPEHTKPVAWQLTGLKP